MMRPSRRATFLYLLPALSLIFIFCYAPMILTFYWSLYPTRNPAKLGAGPINYETLIHSPQFLLVLLNNLWYVAITVPVSMALALLMAALVDAQLPGRMWVRALCYTTACRRICGYDSGQLRGGGAWPKGSSGSG